MLRPGLEDRPTLIGKLLTAMIHQCDLAAPHLETNAEGVMPNENDLLATNQASDWKRLHRFIKCVVSILWGTEAELYLKGMGGGMVQTISSSMVLTFRLFPYMGQLSPYHA